MPKTIEAIYEDGVFKPIKKIRLKEHEKVELSVLTKTEMNGAAKKALSIIGLGASNFKDTARRHDEYLYSGKRHLLKKVNR